MLNSFKINSTTSILPKQIFWNLSILLLKQFQVIMSISYWCWQSISLVTNTFKSCKNVVLCLCLDIYVRIKSKTVIIFKEKCVHGIDCNGYTVAAQSNKTTSFIWGSRNTNHAIFLFLMTKELAQNSEFGDRIRLHVTLAIPLHLCLI